MPEGLPKPAPQSPQLWVSSVSGPGLRAPGSSTRRPARRTVLPQSVPRCLGRSARREKSAARPAQASAGQATSALVAPPLTRSGSRTAGGWSRSSRLPPSCVSPSHLAGPKHAGKLEDPEAERRLPSGLCVCARTHTPTHARTHRRTARCSSGGDWDPVQGCFSGFES